MWFSAFLLIAFLSLREGEIPMKTKDYIFSEFDRIRAVNAILSAFIWLIFLICGFFMLQESGYDPAILLIIFGALAVILVLIPSAIRLRSSSARLARYAISDDSVRMKVGRRVRTLTASEDVHIAVKPFVLGCQEAPVEHDCYVLWRGGEQLSEEFSGTFQTLKEEEIIALPYTDEMRRKLCAIFGEREALIEAVRPENNMQYVFPEEKRVILYGAVSTSQELIICFLLLSVFLFLTHRHEYSGLLLSPKIVFYGFCGLLNIGLLLVLVYGKKRIKYQLARYRFSEDAIVSWVGDKERIIRAADGYRISQRTLLFLRGRVGVEETIYFVLWDSTQPDPGDHIDAYNMLKRPDIIVLPETEEVCGQLQRSLGVKTIGYWLPSKK